MVGSEIKHLAIDLIQQSHVTPIRVIPFDRDANTVRMHTVNHHITAILNNAKNFLRLSLLEIDPEVFHNPALLTTQAYIQNLFHNPSTKKRRPNLDRLCIFKCL
jgi:hypothetical protein